MTAASILRSLDTCSDGSPRTLRDATEELRQFHETYMVPAPANTSGMSDPELAVAAMDALSPDYADDYHQWLQVGMALKSVDADLLGEWERWSKQDPKYSEGACAKKWASFRGTGLTIGSLIYWAKQNGWKPPPVRDPSTSKPKIDTSIKDLSVITPLAWSALKAANYPPTLFRRGGVAARIESGDEKEPILKPLDYKRMRNRLADAASWIGYKRKGKEIVKYLVAPPKDVVDNVLATPDYPLPNLSRIVEAPVFAPDGSLQTTPGYHPQSRTYYAPADGLVVPDVPECPTKSDIESARLLWCDELLGEFPFVGDAELAHAIALGVLSFARDLIAGPTPLHLIEKPSPGTGATLLVDMLALPATGRPIAAMSEGRDEDEWRKRITAILLGSSAFTLIDNLRRPLDSAAVSTAITAPMWEDRILGVSEMARLPVRCVWVATGNNPAVSTEIARRAIRIRMDAKIDRPWLRKDFRHPNLRQWATDNRGLLIWAALTLIQAWITAGRPPGKITLGMFERWAEVIGGILDVAGVPGFLGNLTEFYDDADDEAECFRAFLAAWWGRFSDDKIPARSLWWLASVAALPLGDQSDHSQRIVFGKLLADRRDRVFDLEIDGRTVRLLLKRCEKYQGAYLWQLSEAK